MGKHLGTETTRRELRRGVPGLLRDYESQGPYRTLLQLISNCRDADAGLVKVTYIPEEDYLAIEDDGMGMLPKPGIDDFFDFAGTQKDQVRLTPKGRRVAGCRGIAVIGLTDICEKIHMETRRDGILSVVDHAFPEELLAGEQITIEKYEADAAEHGTKIEMHGLKFKPSKAFDIKYLIRRIPWDRPLFPGFRIVVSDGKEDVELKPRSIEKALFTFRVDSVGKHMGHVEGNVYISRSEQIKETGIYVTVNGERIGATEEYYPWARLSNSLSRSTTMILTADGMDQALTADKTKFKPTHPAVDELKQLIQVHLAEARRIYEKEFPRVRAATFKRQEHLAAVVKKLHANAPHVEIAEPATPHIAGIPEAGTLLERLGLTNDTQFLLVSLPYYLPGRYDPGRQQLLVNRDHPLLAVTEATTPSSYRSNLLFLVMQTVALHGTEPNIASLKAEAQVAAILTGDPVPDREEIVPELVYSAADIARIAGRDIGAVRYMAAAGIFPKSDEGIQGRDYLDLEKRTQGLVTLYEMVKSRDPNVQVVMERFSRLLSKAGRSAQYYATDFGKAQKCYFVESAFEDMVYQLLKDFRQDQGVRVIENGFRAMGKPYLSVDQLAQRCKGIGKEDVKAILDYADRSSIHIGYEGSGKNKRYLLHDFARALHHFRTSA